MRLTKDRKKRCAYDPGVLNKHGALKKQTLRYTVMPTLHNESQALCNEARAKCVYVGVRVGGIPPGNFWEFRLFPMQFQGQAELAS